LKKTLILTLTTFIATSSLALAAPQEQFDISLQQWNAKGSFDYYLHDQGSSQLLSLVSMPQNQNMSILHLRYTPNDRNYIKFQYGSTSSGNKGRGSDSDWQNVGSSTMTDYGTMDFNGDQKMIAIDFGAVVAKSERTKTSVFWGLSRRDTMNQISNVVYHLVGGVNVGNLTQPDNGSYLNGTFSGIHIGVENEYKLNDKILFNTGFNTSYLNAKAYGHWANHFPPWDWENSGNALGFDVTIGLIYILHKNMMAELGYYYSYAKMTDGMESLNYNNGVSNNYSGIDLGYKQRGYYFGLNCKL
jgi:opacity protein-like surface antigen